jgi:hypothetical protein
MHRDASTAAVGELVRLAANYGLVRGEWIALDGPKFCPAANIDGTRGRINRCQPQQFDKRFAS